jgi:6,7-dimethyl-8-ribityllumazine synthase
VGRVTQVSQSLALGLALPLLRSYTQLDNLRIDTAQDRELPSASGFRFAIVATRWNDELVTRLIQGALEALKESDAPDDAVEIFRVPGSFEISLCALKAAESGEFDAVICLGVVIRGETPHFDYVAAETARGIGEASLISGVPLLFGVITADNLEQAHARAGARHDNKGYEAAMAAIEVVNLYRNRFSS